jgi:hypothetical protein
MILLLRKASAVLGDQRDWHPRAGDGTDFTEAIRLDLKYAVAYYHRP